jgi:hypothetical protein
MDPPYVLAWIAGTLLLLVLCMMTLRALFRHERMQLPVYAALVGATMARNRIYLKNNSLTTPQESSLRRLLDGKDNKAYILTMGISVAMFDDVIHAGFTDFYLHEFTKMFTKPRVEQPANSGGRPQRLSPEEGLALTLMYMRNDCAYDPLSLLAGAGPTITCRAVNAGLKALLATLHLMPEADVTFPDHAKQAEYAALVTQRLPHLKGCFGFVDGLAVTVQRSGNLLKQNAYYSGYKSQNKITNVYVFAPDGKVIYESVNHPGSWADSSAFESLMSIIEKPDQVLFAKDHWIAADAAFRANTTTFVRKVMSKKAFKKLKRQVRAGTITQQKFKKIKKRQRALTTARQSVEHGMRSLRTSRRLNSNLTINNDAKRLLIMTLATRLHNFRASRLPLNHIARDFDALPEAALNADI